MRIILAIQPNSQRLGYAVLRGSTLADHGTKHFGSGQPIGHRIHQIAIPFVRTLIERYNPDVVVLPAATKQAGTARNRFLRGIGYEHRRHEYSVASLSRKKIRETFTRFLKPKRPSKDRIMGLITKWFQNLLEYLPKPRRLWVAENYWVPMFDAVSLAVTFLDHDL